MKLSETQLRNTINDLKDSYDKKVVVKSDISIIEFVEGLIIKLQSFRDSGIFVEDDKNKLVTMISSLAIEKQVLEKAENLDVSSKIDATKLLVDRTGEILLDIQKMFEKTVVSVGDSLTSVVRIMEPEDLDPSERYEGADRLYNIRKAPIDWSVRYHNWESYINETVYNITDPHRYRKIPGMSSTKEILTFESGKKISIIPIPGRTKLEGRIFPTALEIVVPISIAVVPMDRASYPLYVPRDMRTNLLLKISQSLVVADVDDIRVGMIGKRNFMIVECSQELHDVMVCDEFKGKVIIDTKLIGVQGSLRDYMLMLRYPIIEGTDDSQLRENVQILEKILTSFQPKMFFDEDEEYKNKLQLLIVEQDDKFNRIIEDSSEEVFQAEWTMLAYRLSGLNLDKSEDLVKAIKLTKPFKAMAGMLKLVYPEDLDDVWNSIEKAEHGDPYYFKAFVAEMFDNYVTDEEMPHPRSSKYVAARLEEQLRYQQNTWYNEGLTLAKQGKYDEAIESFDKALEFNPKYAEAWYGKGASLASQGKYDEAIESFDKALEIHPEDADVWYNKGTSLASQGKYDEAIESFDKALEIHPEDAEAWYGKGTSLANQGKYREAIECFDKTIEIDPDHAYAYNNKGNALNNLGIYEEAIKHFDKAIEIDPEDAYSWNNKGLALYNLKKYEEAIKSYDKAIEIDPGYLDALNNKSKVLYELGNYESAIKCLDRVIEIEPQNAGALYNRACSKIKKGSDVNDGLADLKKAIEINKESIEMARQDKDFDDIRDDQRFRDLL